MSNIINNENKNPYFLAWIKQAGLKTGDKYKIVDYMCWIDEKHCIFRELVGLPENISLNEDETKMFIKFINE